ncbi:MAG: GntR family transcriptional regulator [Microbacterium sp.]
MARTRNAPEGVPRVDHDVDGKRELIEASLEEFARQTGPGTLVPSERVLAEQFSVARMTARSAVSALVSRGMMMRVPGRGTFVQRPLAAQRVLRSFTEDMRLRGMTPGTREFKIVRQPASAFVAEKLEIPTGDEVFYIERVRTADDVPIALERTHIPESRFPDLDRDLHHGDSLHEVLASRHNVVVFSAEQTVVITDLNDHDAKLLDTATGEAAFGITNTARDSMGGIVEFGRSLYRGDRYAFQIAVSRNTQ